MAADSFRRVLHIEPVHRLAHHHHFNKADKSHLHRRVFLDIVLVKAFRLPQPLVVCLVCHRPRSVVCLRVPRRHVLVVPRRSLRRNVQARLCSNLPQLHRARRLLQPSINNLQCPAEHFQYLTAHPTSLTARPSCPLYDPARDQLPPLHTHLDHPLLEICRDHLGPSCPRPEDAHISRLHNTETPSNRRGFMLRTR